MAALAQVVLYKTIFLFKTTQASQSSVFEWSGRLWAIRIPNLFGIRAPTVFYYYCGEAHSQWCKLHKCAFSKNINSKKSGFQIPNVKGNFSVNRKDLKALTLVGPTREDIVLDPLGVQHLMVKTLRVQDFHLLTITSQCIIEL